MSNKVVKALLRRDLSKCLNDGFNDYDLAQQARCNCEIISSITVSDQTFRLNLWCYHHPPGLALFLPKWIYHIQVSIGVTLSVLFTTEKSFNTGDVSSAGSSTSQQLKWNGTLKLIIVLHIQNENVGVLVVIGILHQLICIGTLRARSWVRIVANMALEQLVKTSISRPMSKWDFKDWTKYRPPAFKTNSDHYNDEWHWLFICQC